MENQSTIYRFESVCDPTPEMTEAVNSELRQFNQAVNPHFYKALSQPGNEAKALNIFVYDQEGQICGGLFAETLFLWLKISIMAVREDLRGQGIGTELMAIAEAEAWKRGCKHAYVDTMDYQAPNFYLRLGYRVAGHLENWDSQGHSKFYLVKQL
jgi:GNAT superfamily N-acetyltransferase